MSTVSSETKHYSKCKYENLNTHALRNLHLACFNGFTVIYPCTCCKLDCKQVHLDVSDARFANIQ